MMSRKVRFVGFDYFVLSLPSFDCLCKPHVLTEKLHASLFRRHYKLLNAHLPDCSRTVLIKRRFLQKSCRLYQKGM